MKIAYIINHDITTNDGVTKKILGQKTEWEKFGNQVEVYCTLPEKGDSILEAKQYMSTAPLRQRFRLQENFLFDIGKFMPDIVYFRYGTWSRTLSKVFDRYKVIAELNTYDLGEFWAMLKNERTLKSLLRYMAYKFLRSKVLSRVAGIVAVTKEIAEHPSNKKFNKQTTYIPNGIDLEKYKTIKVIDNSSQRTGLFFIGTPNQLWHGVDIIEKMADKLSEYDFHIVGMEGENTSNLFWHGYLQKEKYLQVLKKCHFGIGTLALYRKDMQEACPLKVREYLAYGYPLILGYDDTAFIDKKLPDWVLKIDTQRPLEAKEIKNFIENHKKTAINHNQVSYIHTFYLEKERLDFFQGITLNK